MCLYSQQYNPNFVKGKIKLLIKYLQYEKSVYVVGFILFEAGGSFPVHQLQTRHIPGGRKSDRSETHIGRNSLYWQTWAIWVGEALNAKYRTLPGTFLWLCELGVCALACWHSRSWIFRRFGISPFTYVWSFCKHVSAGNMRARCIQRVNAAH